MCLSIVLLKDVPEMRHLHSKLIRKGCLRAGRFPWIIIAVKKTMMSEWFINACMRCALACTCVCCCHIPFRQIEKWASIPWQKPGALVKGDGACRSSLGAAPPDIDKKASADLVQLELGYQYILAFQWTLTSSGEGEKSVGNDTWWQLSQVGSIGDKQPEEDVRRNFEGWDKIGAIGFIIIKAQHAHARRRSSYSPRFSACSVVTNACLLFWHINRTDGLTEC